MFLNTTWTCPFEDNNIKRINRVTYRLRESYREVKFLAVLFRTLSISHTSWHSIWQSFRHMLLAYFLAMHLASVQKKSDISCDILAYKML